MDRRAVTCAVFANHLVPWNFFGQNFRKLPAGKIGRNQNSLAWQVQHSGSCQTATLRMNDPRPCCFRTQATGWMAELNAIDLT